MASGFIIFDVVEDHSKKGKKLIRSRESDEDTQPVKNKIFSNQNNGINTYRTT